LHYVVVGLGFGDEGKGATVDFLARKLGLPDVVKYCGGHQCGHRVVTSDCKSHVFSQFGSGTLAGSKTLVGRKFIIEPFAMAAERKALRDLGFSPINKVDGECLVTTIYHRALNRIEQKWKRRNNTCGVGVGYTRETSLCGLDLRVADFADASVAIRKLDMIRDWCVAKVHNIIGVHGPSMHSSLGPELLEFEVSPRKLYRDMWKTMRFAIDSTGWIDELDQPCIFEAGQGVLLDELYGEKGVNTWSTVTARDAIELVGEGKEYEIVGAMRTYLTRHGDGDTGCSTMNPQWEEPSNGNTGPQGEFRTFHWASHLLETAMLLAHPSILAINHQDVYELPAWLEDKFCQYRLINGFGPAATHRRSTFEF